MTTTVTGLVQSIRHFDTSANLNPRWEATFVADDGTTLTLYNKIDSQLGYSLPNWRGDRATVDIKEHYGKYCITNIRLPEERTS